MFNNELFMARHGHEKEDDVEIIIPIRLTVGVTVALVDLLISVVFLFTISCVFRVCRFFLPE